MHISLQKTSTRPPVADTKKAGRPMRQSSQWGRQANETGRPMMQAGQLDRQAKWSRQARLIVPALSANIFTAATGRTNIHNKTGYMHH